MDIPNLTVDRISFTGSGNTISSSSGKTLSISSATIATNLDSAATGNKTASSLTLRPVGAVAVSVNSGSGQLTIDSPITGSGPMTFSGAAGAGTTLTGTSDFTGVTTVASGVLTLDNSGIDAAITGSALQVGTGSGPGATVQLAQALEIADATNVLVNSDGVLDMQGAIDKVGSLTIDRGLVKSISAGSPGLAIVGGLAMSGGTIDAGGPLGVGGEVSATSVAGGPATINSPLTVSGGQFAVTDGPDAVDLLLSKPISQPAGTPVDVTKAGAGTMRIAAPTTSSYTGITSVLDGTLTLSGTGAAVLPATTLKVGDGAGAVGSAVVTTTTATDVAAATTGEVASDGALNLQAADQHLLGLSVLGGSINLGTRTLTLGGGLTMAGGTIAGTSAAQLVLGGNVTATSTATGAVIGVALALGGARTFTVNAGLSAPDLTLGGNVSDGPHTGSITKAGAGTVLMQPPSGSLYSGGTTVADGVLQTNSPVTASIATGGLTIGDGIGAPGSAVVKTLTAADITTATTVNRDGVLDPDGHGQNLPGLIVNDGEVRLGSSNMFVNVLAMTGGTINGTGTLSIQPLGPANLPPTMSFATSASGPAHLAYTGVTFVNATTTLTVAPAGAAPEFVLDGVIQIAETSHVIKQGGGTALFKGPSIPKGFIDVQAGTFDAAANLLPQFTVASGATLTGTGQIGPAVVDGTLAPRAPMLTASSGLAFGASGRLRVTVPSAVAAEAPSVKVLGSVNIASGAMLDLGIASGVTLPAGTKLALITNDLADAITGRFSNAPGGPFTESGGRSLTLSYAGSDGNDLEATVDAVQPTPTSTPFTPTPTSSATPAPTPTVADKPVVVKLTAARRQRFVRSRKLRVRLSCSSLCVARLVTSVNPPGKSSKTSSAPPIRATVAPGRPVTITVRVPKAARARIQSALLADRKVVVRVKATARDAASKLSAAPRTVRIILTT